MTEEQVRADFYASARFFRAIFDLASERAQIHNEFWKDHPELNQREFFDWAQSTYDLTSWLGGETVFNPLEAGIDCGISVSEDTIRIHTDIDWKHDGSFSHTEYVKFPLSWLWNPNWQDEYRAELQAEMEKRLQEKNQREAKKRELELQQLKALKEKYPDETPI